MSTSPLYCDNKLDILDTFQRSSSSTTATSAAVTQSMTSAGGVQYTTSAAAGGSMGSSGGGGTIQEVAARLNGGGGTSKSDVNAGRSLRMYIDTYTCVYTLSRGCVVFFIFILAHFTRIRRHIYIMHILHMHMCYIQTI